MKRLISTYLEPIECMATIGRDVQNNFCVTVNPDQNRLGDCYFKCYNSRSYSSADKVIRISLKNPKVFIHSNRDGKSTWVLNSKDKKNLVEFLSSPSQDFENVSNWQSVLYNWNNEMDLISDPPIGYSTRMQAFVNGYYDTKENMNDANYVPSDTQMPDYTKIEY